MSDSRQMITWLLLVLVAVVGGGAAVLGVVAGPEQRPAVAGRRQHPGGLQLLRGRHRDRRRRASRPTISSTRPPTGWAATSRAGTSAPTSTSSGPSSTRASPCRPPPPTKHLIFYQQPSQGAATLDPAHNYLQYANQAKNVKQSGATYYLHADPERPDRDLRLHRVRPVRLVGRR